MSTLTHTCPGCHRTNQELLRCENCDGWFCRDCGDHCPEDFYCRWCVQEFMARDYGMHGYVPVDHGPKPPVQATCECLEYPLAPGEVQCAACVEWYAAQGGDAA
jgi:hypothetical protein